MLGTIDSAGGPYDLEPATTWCENCGFPWKFCPTLHAYGFKVVRFDQNDYIRLLRLLIFCPACNRDTWHNTQKPQPAARISRRLKRPNSRD